MMLSVNLYAKERRGAKLIVTQKDGQQIEGELITVKIPQKSLLLLDTEGKDVSIDITDIKIIKIVKKSKVLLGAGLGFLIGAGAGALIGLAIWGGGSSDIFTDFEGAMVCGVKSALPGALIGGIWGAVEGIDKTVQIEGKSDIEIAELLAKLRRKARIRDYK